MSLLPLWPAYGAGPETLRVAQAAQGMLKVKPNVEGAKVYLNNELIGETPVIKMVNPGAYSLKITHPYHADYTLELNVSPGQVVTLDPNLTTTVGDLRVNANVDGAAVFVDGEEIGLTPEVVVHALKIGLHDVRVEKAGYLSYGGSVRVEPRFQVKLDVSLTANAATLAVKANVPDAEVFLDGERLGVTPLETTTISGGRHALTVSAPGFASVYRSFQVRIGEGREIDVSLPEKGGKLKVTSKVEGATVFLEGASLGEAPVALETLAPGAYTVRVTAEGFADALERVEVKKGRRVRLNVDLQPVSEFEHAQVKAHGRGRGEREGRPVLWIVLGAVALGGAGTGTWAILSGSPGGTGAPGDVAVTLP